MYAGKKIQSLEEDFKKLGLKVNEDVDIDIDDDNDNLDEGFKIVKKKRGAEARRRARMAKKYYRKHRAKLKRLAKKWRKTAKAKRYLKKLAAFKKRRKIPKGKRVRLASYEDVELLKKIIEAYEITESLEQFVEAIEKMIEGAALMSENVVDALEQIYLVASEVEDEDLDDDEEEDIDEETEMDSLVDEFVSNLEKLEEAIEDLDESLDNDEEDICKQKIEKAYNIFKDVVDAYSELMA